MTPRLRRECERDLDLLGQWLPLIEGAALPLPEQRVDGGEGRNGRPDVVDRCSKDYSRAVRALRALDRVEPAHAAVLWYAFVSAGEETRDLYDGCVVLDEQGKKMRLRVHIGDLTYDVQHPGGWYGRVALIFAPEEQRTEWLLLRGPGSTVKRNAAMRLVGEGKVNAALDAYSAARSASGVDTVKRLDLARLRAATAAANARADRELVALTRARETSKTRKAKRS